MAFQDPRELIQVPAYEQQGPAMRALTEIQRRFVCALAVYGGNQREAARWAGYSASNENTLHAGASRAANLPAIRMAVDEESRRRLDQASIIAVSTLVELAAANSCADAKTRLKASEMILDRTGFHGKTEHLVVHEDKRTSAELIKFIQERGAANNIDVNKWLGLPAPAVMDAEFSEVDPDLADLL